jgi:hypothetical protein
MEELLDSQFSTGYLYSYQIKKRVKPFFNLNPYAVRYSKSYLYQAFSKTVSQGSIYHLRKP